MIRKLIQMQYNTRIDAAQALLDRHDSCRQIRLVAAKAAGLGYGHLLAKQRLLLNRYVHV
jgi:hypothetical protein